MVKAFVVIGPEEGSKAEAVPRKVMASRLMVNTKVVPAILLEPFLYHSVSLFDIEQCYCASPQNRVERKEMLTGERLVLRIKHKAMIQEAGIWLLASLPLYS